MTIYIVDPPEGKVYQASNLQEHMRHEASDLKKEDMKDFSTFYNKQQKADLVGWWDPLHIGYSVLKKRKENNQITLCNTWEEVKEIMKGDGMYQCPKCDEWMVEDYLGFCGRDRNGKYWDCVCDDCDSELKLQ